MALKEMVQQFQNRRGSVAEISSPRRIRLKMIKSESKTECGLSILLFSQLLLYPTSSADHVPSERGERPHP